MRTLLTLAICAALAPSPPSVQNAVVIDHFILGINDLERGVADFERLTGVRMVFGGVHPGRGTQNALASLGGGRYIEVLAPDPKQANPAQPIGGLGALTALTPSGWALGSTDLAATRKLLEAADFTASPVRAGSRALPDGSRLEWSTFGIIAPAHNWLPFFIQWGNPAMQPSRTSPGGCRFASVEIADPAPEPLRRLFEAVSLRGVAHRTAQQSRMTIALDCPKGRVVFG